MWFVFNELSARVGAESRHEGGSRMDGLVDAVGMVMNGRPAELVSIGESGLWGAELTSGYTVAQWFETARVERRRLLLSIATKTEFPQEVDEATKNRFFLSEFSLLDGVESQRGTEVRGLGAAFVLGGTAVSLPSEEQWRAMRIPLHHIWYDQSGSEQENCVTVLNLSERHQAEGVSDSLLEASQTGLKSSPISLAERKAECFPHLSFGRDVCSQIAKLPPALLPRVVAKLAELDDASRAWRRNAQRNRPVLPNCRRESEPTMQQFGDRRVFRDTKGEKRTYELHKNVGLEYRIHLRIVHEARGLEIGYIGEHLPTRKSN